VYGEESIARETSTTWCINFRERSKCNPLLSQYLSWTYLQSSHIVPSGFRLTSACSVSAGLFVLVDTCACVLSSLRSSFMSSGTFFFPCLSECPKSFFGSIRSLTNCLRTLVSIWQELNPFFHFLVYKQQHKRYESKHTWKATLSLSIP
jgi:hypothetical protein